VNNVNLKKVNKLILLVLFSTCTTPKPDVFRGKERKEYRTEQKRIKKPIVNPLRMNINNQK
jgi:hypothetical protein